MIFPSSVGVTDAPFSLMSSGIGEKIVSQPAKIASDARAVCPARIVTLRAIVPAPLFRISVWDPGCRSVIVIGDRPRVSPSSVMSAPSGVVSTFSDPNFRFADGGGVSRGRRTSVTTRFGAGFDGDEANRAIVGMPVRMMSAMLAAIGSPHFKYFLYSNESNEKPSPLAPRRSDARSGDLCLLCHKR